MRLRLTVAVRRLLHAPAIDPLPFRRGNRVCTRRREGVPRQRWSRAAPPNLACRESTSRPS